MKIHGKDHLVMQLDDITSDCRTYWKVFSSLTYNKVIDHHGNETNCGTNCISNILHRPLKISLIFIFNRICSFYTLYVLLSLNIYDRLSYWNMFIEFKNGFHVADFNHTILFRAWSIKDKVFHWFFLSEIHKTRQMILQSMHILCRQKF